MSRVLVIEDTPDNLVLISDILEMNGHQVLQAETGRQGIEKALSEQPDFVLLDIQLPDIDGYVVLDSLRSDPRTSKLRVVAMTSYAMAGDRERLLAAGCDGYIEKPIDPARVMAQIRNMVDKGK